MTLSTIVSMLIGFGLPLLVTLVTKEALPDHLKALILLFLATVSGVVTSILGTLPTTLNGWEHVALNILLTFAVAAAAEVKLWLPTGIAPALSKRTAGFGLGPVTPPAMATPPG